jgi:hypothetical protein
MFEHQTKMAVGLDTTTAKNIKLYEFRPPQILKMAKLERTT